MILLFVFLTPALPAADLAPVILNEIHYHPAGAGGLLEEFVELHNRTDSEIDLHGWQFSRGIRFRFDRASTPFTIPARGFLLVARNPAALARVSGIPATAIAGPYEGKLSNFEDRLVLVDTGSEVMEDIEYSQDGSWPAGADGLGSSLQRISSEAPGNLAQNWVVAVAGDRITPGRSNAVVAAAPPPLVSFVERLPEEPRSSDSVIIRVRIEGELEHADLYYDAGSGEKAIRLRDDGRGPDRRAGDGIHAAGIPPAPDRTVVRFRITARGPAGSVFHFPRRGNPSSHLGYYVLDEPRKSNVDLEVFHILWNGRLRCTRGIWLPGCTFVHRGTAHLNVGLKYRGLTSCGMPKTGLKVKFNRGDLFRGREQLNFLAGWQDRSLLRERLAWGLFRNIGHPHAEPGMAAVYSNGNRFHGLFVSLDEPGSDYLRRNGIDSDNTLWKCTSSFLGVENPRYRRFRKLTNSEERGDESALLELERNLTSLKGREHLDYVLKHIDVESLIEYHAIKCILSDEDAYTKNWMLCQETVYDAVAGESFDRWTVHPWDLDLSFGQYSLNQDEIQTDRHPLAGTVDHPRVGSHGLRWSGFLEAVFGRESGDYFIKALYGRIWGLLEDEFHPSVLAAQIDRLDANTIAEARADLEKWPRWGIEPQDPEFHRERLRAYVSTRHEFLRGLISSEHPTTASEVVPWLPFLAPRVADGVAPPRALTYRTFRYTRAPRLKISEIHYNPKENGPKENGPKENGPKENGPKENGPKENGDGLEFVEIRNLETDEDVDISGWNLPALGFSFPAGSEAPAGATIVLARDPVALMARHENLSRRLVFGPYPGRLSNQGEDLRLRDSGRYQGKQFFPETIDVVKYRDRSPWPAAADGEGSSLELKDLSLDNDLPESWRASSRQGGSPGR